VQGRYRDLQQQSDRGKHPTETAGRPAGLSALLFSPRPYGHIEGALRPGAEQCCPMMRPLATAIVGKLWRLY
jgi:hypothetical protein